MNDEQDEMFRTLINVLGLLIVAGIFAVIIAAIAYEM
jgi:hypothetical protein